jgi:tRNA (cytidine/uridine-2'-O-)-methyltransferase
MINIVLVYPQIPPNTGNVARLSAGLGLKLHLVKPLGFSTDDRYLKRAGLDYWPHVDLTYHESLEEFFASNPDGNFYFCTTKTKRAYTAIKYQPNDFLLFGSETKGLPESLLKQNESKTITIPMNGKIRSFNLSSAVSMITGEALRQLQCI